MDLSIGSLVASLVVSSAGFGFFLYGKKQGRFPQLIAGLALVAYPYFVSGPLAMWGIAGAILLALWAAERAGV